MSTNTNSQRPRQLKISSSQVPCGEPLSHSQEKFYGYIAPCDSSQKTKFKTQRLDRSPCNEKYYKAGNTEIRFIPSRLVRLAARQPPREIHQDFGSICGSDSIRIEYRGQVPSLTLTPRLHQVIHNKTFAVMRCYGGFPDVYAKSGWGHNQVENFIISGKDWTTKVMNFCREIKFFLRPNLDYDQGVPGQYNASHAEKQLIAYFIFKQLESNTESEGDVSRLLGNLSLAGKNEQVVKAKLIELWKSRPQQHLNRVVILVSRSVCSDCKRFSRHVQVHLGLQIEVQSVQAVCSSTLPENKA